MLFSEDMRRNPYPLYEQMRASSPVLHVPQADLWMLFEYEQVKWALTDHATFSSRSAPAGGDPLSWMIFSDPPRHTKLRAIINRVFTPRAVADLEPRVRELSRALLEQTAERAEMDVAADFAVPLPLMVIAEMLGIPVADRPRFKRWSDVILNMAETVSGGEAGQRAAAAFRDAGAEMRPYLAGLLAQRRRRPTDDLLTRLLHAEVDGERLSADELLGFFQLLLLAGSETTTNLISNAILCFSEHPDQLARLRSDPALLPSAIEEVLRYRSPVQAMFRTTTREVEVRGQTIPAGKLVLPVIGSANRDPQQFADAERFDIGRDPNPHLAFGHGIHFCIGAPLARLEARVALPDLLDRLRIFELTGDAPWEPRKAFHVHGPTRLPVRLEPRRRATAP